MTFSGATGDGVCWNGFVVPIVWNQPGYPNQWSAVGVAPPPGWSNSIISNVTFNYFFNTPSYCYITISISGSSGTGVVVQGPATVNSCSPINFTINVGGIGGLNCSAGGVENTLIATITA
jgi:hypothetical protein